MRTTTRSKLLQAPLIAGLIVSFVSPAWAVTIKNADAETRTITITESGERTEQEILPDETVTVCEEGCFITFPNGALTAYTGTEDIVISNGAPVLPF